MLLRMSTYFLRTLRDDPADAVVPSDKLLTRGGYVRRVAPGVFSWLPLGYLTYRKVEEIVREEMNLAGFQEVHFPALLPTEPYEATNRWTEYGPNLFRLKDRRGVDYLLGPTHEEMFTLMVKDLYSSYKDLPLVIYQIQTKYRDEARPRAGILRGREFVMKDAYSFDTDQKGLDVSYQKHRDAYIKTFKRLGLDFVIVSAMSGAMGGSKSEEFLAPCEFGEDTYVKCEKCEYAANVEAVTTPVPKDLDFSKVPAAHAEDTPNTPTIDTLVEVSNSRKDLRREDRDWNAADTLKNVVVMLTHPDGKNEPLVVGVPGDREVDMRRLEAVASPATVRVFEETDFPKYPALVRGYIGPQALGLKSASKIKYLVDPRIVSGTRWITGSNIAGKHVYDLVSGRDFTADGTIEAAEIKVGDVCPSCAGKLTIARGIEIGHIFQLGKKYAEALDLKVLDENGKTQVVTMGSYGIGVSRAVAAIIEQNHDEQGIVWPETVAPISVQLVAAGKEDSIFAEAEKIAQSLDQEGIAVMFDDRKSVSPGVKFNDAELLGMPWIVVVGKKLAEGLVEVKNRKTGERQDVEATKIVSHLKSII
ncbi:MAG: proline--tRNA ligase [Actinobacteria bacterium]|nr:proline--tRNA ligase [Actinomycetota bacterium]